MIFQNRKNGFLQFDASAYWFIAMAGISFLFGSGILAVASLLFDPLPDHALPNPVLTPGETRVVDLQTLCTAGSSKDARHVPQSLKQAVYQRYDLRGNHTGYCAIPHGCEIDHLIPLELGGANTMVNLWPEPYTGSWNARMKDRLENRLHREVCTGTLSLAVAQLLIQSNWIHAYRVLFLSQY